jgi:RNA polymerase sigma-70 factor (ECF subfamily)
MSRVAVLIMRDSERAKDAIQEALIRAWRDLPSLRDPERYEAWQRQLLVRSCIDELRRGRRLSVEVELLDIDIPRADDSRSVDDREALERAFRLLDADQRAVVVLHYYEGLPLDEAAAALRVPVGTAKSRLHRARATLRAALDADARVVGLHTEGRT